MKTVRIACKGSRLVSLDELVIIQGNLKELSKENYEKLRDQILRLGFSAPFFIWADPQRIQKVLDGTQRVNVLRKMRDEEGYAVPPLPACDIEAADEREAKEKILAFVSQYGIVTNEGLYEFMSGLDMTIEDLEKRFSMPEIDLDQFRREFGQESAPGPEAPTQDGGLFDRSANEYQNSTVKQIVLFFGPEQYEEVLRRFETAMVGRKLKDFSEVVWSLLDDYSRDPTQANPGEGATEASGS